jgi:hypothetical protein
MAVVSSNLRFVILVISDVVVPILLEAIFSTFHLTLVTFVAILRTNVVLYKYEVLKWS